MEAKNKKYWLITAWMVFSGWVFWLFVAQSFAGNLADIWTFPLVFFVFHASSIILFVLIENRPKFFLAFLLASLFPALLIGGTGWMAIFLVLLLVVLLASLLFRHLRDELESRTRIRIYFLSSMAAGQLVWIFSLLITAIFFVFAQTGKYQQSPDFSLGVSPRLVDLGLGLSKGVFSDSETQKGIDLIIDGGTVDQYLNLAVTNQLEMQAEISPEILSEIKKNPSLLEGMKREAIEGQKQALAKQLGVEISGSEKVKELVLVFLNSKISESLNLAGEKGVSSQSPRPIAPIFLTMGFFLLLISIGYLIKIPLKIFSVGLFWLLKQAKFFSVTTEQKEVEKVAL